MIDSTQRRLWQQLESWRRAGLTHLPRGHELDLAEAVTPDPSVAVATEPVNTPAAVPTAAHPAHTLLPEPTTDSMPTRAQKLNIIAERVSGCARCPELAATRTQTVFGVGDPHARVLFLGEAPGADEDKTGIPFVGRAGQLLDKIIAAAKMKREDIYICNILRCRPPGNRTPLPEEANNCREYLNAQLEIVKPEYIVCWGAVAAQNLLGVTDSIGKLRGRFLQYEQAKVLCTYHPSYLLRNPAAKKQVWEDIQLLMQELGIPID